MNREANDIGPYDDSEKKPQGKRVRTPNAAKTTSKVDQSVPPAVTDLPENKPYCILFLIIALIVGSVGVYVAYSDAKVVGGDAYNYVIGASRGASIVGLAIIFALIGVANAIFHVANVTQATEANRHAKAEK